MSETDDLAFLSLAEVSARLRRRAVSCVEVTETALRRAETLQPRLNPFIRITGGQQLLDAARRADRRGQAEDASPLLGIPLTLKDLIDVEGQPTTAGGVIPDLVQRPTTSDAPVWARLKNAGALLLGKTNLHEFAYGATTVNPHYGPAHNPWNMERIAGGSSGGSAVALAAGIGYASLGSDTGGSIRSPAALCGVTGLKPTYGRVPLTGVFPLSESQDHVGPMARSALDCAMVLDAISGADSSDRATRGVAPARTAEAVRAAPPSLRGMRLGVLAGHRSLVCDPGLLRVFDAAVDTLRVLGAAVDELEMPEEQEALDAGLTVLTAEATALHLRWLRAMPDLYGAEVRARLEGGIGLLATDYLVAQQARRSLTGRILGRMSAYDAVLGPTVPIVAPPIEASSIYYRERDVDPRTVLLRLTRLFDVTGQPAVSVPCGFSEDGLPVGLQVASHPWREDVALCIAHVYQQATDWHRRRPALAALSAPVERRST